MPNRIGWQWTGAWGTQRASPRRFFARILASEISLAQAFMRIHAWDRATKNNSSYTPF